jgi:NAD(P)-dependent dehydrogenase (short-subunit alcohol dehydrogenase family)
VVGGIGGIGKSVCQWLVRHGAKNLIIMSRSAKSAKNQVFIDEMASLGCKVYASGCDISEPSAMAAAVQDCASKMPPIKGVIQGAMVLQVSNCPRNYTLCSH